MKILIAGDWHSDIHEKPLYDSLKTLGHDVHRFAWSSYYKSTFLDRLQNKFLFGTKLKKINDDLYRKTIEIKPEIVIVYRGTHILKETIEKSKLSEPHTKWIGYNNDDPFSDRNPFYLWKHFLKALPEYDLMFAYRLNNIDEFKKHGSRKVKLLRSWFIPEVNKKVELTPEELKKYGCDVAFIGHFEDDGRDRLIEKIVSKGFNFKLYGPEWEKVVQKSSVLRPFSPVLVPRGAEYNKAINGAKICLCFLSKLNRDQYTRRCFEIPAAGTMLFSEYSDDLATLFTEGKEAEFFRNEEELLSKLKYYSGNPDKIESIARAGLKRVQTDGHDVLSRARYLIQSVQEF